MKFFHELTGRHWIAAIFVAVANASIAQAPMMIGASGDSGASDTESSIRIVAPVDEETIHDNNGNVTVWVAAEQPPDAEDSAIELSLDGHLVAAQQHGHAFTVSGIDRGTHTLQARSVDKDGAVAQSEPVTFYMWQASALNRQSK